MKEIANVISAPMFRSGLLCSAVSVALAAAIWPTVAESQQQAAVAAAAVNTASPIKHVIVVVGENRTFDHVFGAYTPRQGQTVANLLSKGIITADGRAGPNFALAAQYTASPKFGPETLRDRAWRQAAIYRAAGAEYRLYGKHTERYQSAAVRHARRGASRRGRDDRALGRRALDHRSERLADA